MAEAGDGDRVRALEAEVARLRAMLSSAPDFVTLITLDGRFLYLNRLAPGFRMEEVIGTSVHNYVPPEFHEQSAEAVRRARETRTVQQYTTVGQVTAERMGHYLTRISPVIENDEVIALVMTATDITELEQSRSERRLLEARLLEAEKLESLGRLAGGVAHDFNNMLTAILGHAQFAATAASVEEARDHAEQIRVAAERSAALTAQLLAFARRQIIEPKTLAPNDIIVRLEALLGRVLGEHIQIRQSLRARGKIRADASQFEQVLLNLVTNARDAMPTGGVLSIATEDVYVVGQEAGLDLAPGAYVVISVTDTGPGISPEALPHLFEPFYTTREAGTGLGLATCYGIVKQSGGTVTVDSHFGVGASFRVYLPCVEGHAEELDEPSARFGELVASPRPPARVLVVEDDPAVRGVLARTLARANYQVRVAGNPGDALKIADEDGPFEALVTDMVMPGMGGMELISELLQKWPALKVLCVSGYLEDARVRDEVAHGKLQFLQKPFVPAELLEAMRRILSER